MAAAIRDAQPSAEVELIPGGRGDFIVQLNGAVLWNKRAMGDGFPAEGDILAKLET